MQDDDSHLKSLGIVGSGASSVNWTSLPVELLAQVLVSLDKGSFYLIGAGPTYQLIVRTFQFNEWWIWTIVSLSPDHISSLFQLIAETSVMNMKELSLNSYGQIPHIPPELLSQALIKLETFQAKGAFLTAAQISAVFTRLSVMGEHKLKTSTSAETISVQSTPTSWWREYLA